MSSKKKTPVYVTDLSDPLWKSVFKELKNKEIDFEISNNEYKLETTLLDFPVKQNSIDEGSSEVPEKNYISINPKVDVKKEFLWYTKRSNNVELGEVFKTKLGDDFLDYQTYLQQIGPNIGATDNEKIFFYVLLHYGFPVSQLSLLSNSCRGTPDLYFPIINDEMIYYSKGITGSDYAYNSGANDSYLKVKDAIEKIIKDVDHYKNRWMVFSNLFYSKTIVSRNSYELENQRVAGSQTIKPIFRIWFLPKEISSGSSEFYDDFDIKSYIFTSASENNGLIPNKYSTKFRKIIRISSDVKNFIPKKQSENIMESDEYSFKLAIENNSDNLIFQHNVFKNQKPNEKPNEKEEYVYVVDYSKEYELLSKPYENRITKENWELYQHTYAFDEGPSKTKAGEEFFGLEKAKIHLYSKFFPHFPETFSLAYFRKNFTNREQLKSKYYKNVDFHKHILPYSPLSNGTYHWLTKEDYNDMTTMSGLFDVEKNHLVVGLRASDINGKITHLLVRFNSILSDEDTEKYLEKESIFLIKKYEKFLVEFKKVLNTNDYFFKKKKIIDDYLQNYFSFQNTLYKKPYKKKPSLYVYGDIIYQISDDKEQSKTESFWTDDLRGSNRYAFVFSQNEISTGKRNVDKTFFGFTRGFRTIAFDANEDDILYLLVDKNKITLNPPTISYGSGESKGLPSNFDDVKVIYPFHCFKKEGENFTKTLLIEKYIESTTETRELYGTILGVLLEKAKKRDGEGKPSKAYLVFSENNNNDSSLNKKLPMDKFSGKKNWKIALLNSDFFMNDFQKFYDQNGNQKQPRVMIRNGSESYNFKDESKNVLVIFQNEDDRNLVNEKTQLVYAPNEKTLITLNLEKNGGKFFIPQKRSWKKRELSAVFQDSEGYKWNINKENIDVLEDESLILLPRQSQKQKNKALPKNVSDGSIYIDDVFEVGKQEKYEGWDPHNIEKLGKRVIDGKGTVYFGPVEKISEQNMNSKSDCFEYIGIKHNPDDDSEYDILNLKGHNENIDILKKFTHSGKLIKHSSSNNDTYPSQITNEGNFTKRKKFSKFLPKPDNYSDAEHLVVERHIFEDNSRVPITLYSTKLEHSFSEEKNVNTVTHFVKDDNSFNRLKTIDYEIKPDFNTVGQKIPKYIFGKTFSWKVDEMIYFNPKFTSTKYKTPLEVFQKVIFKEGKECNYNEEDLDCDIKFVGFSHVKAKRFSRTPSNITDKLNKGLRKYDTIIFQVTKKVIDVGKLSEQLKKYFEFQRELPKKYEIWKKEFYENGKLKASSDKSDYYDWKYWYKGETLFTTITNVTDEYFEKIDVERLSEVPLVVPPTSENTLIFSRNGTVHTLMKDGEKKYNHYNLVTFDNKNDVPEKIRIYYSSLSSKSEEDKQLILNYFLSFNFGWFEIDKKFSPPEDGNEYVTFFRRSNNKNDFRYYTWKIIENYSPKSQQINLGTTYIKYMLNIIEFNEQETMIGLINEMYYSKSLTDTSNNSGYEKSYNELFKFCEENKKLGVFEEKERTYKEFSDSKKKILSNFTNEIRPLLNHIMQWVSYKGESIKRVIKPFFVILKPSQMENLSSNQTEGIKYNRYSLSPNSIEYMVFSSKVLTNKQLDEKSNGRVSIDLGKKIFAMIGGQLSPKIQILSEILVYPCRETNRVIFSRKESDNKNWGYKESIVNNSSDTYYIYFINEGKNSTQNERIDHLRVTRPTEFRGDPGSTPSELEYDREKLFSISCEYLDIGRYLRYRNESTKEDRLKVNHFSGFTNYQKHHKIYTDKLFVGVLKGSYDIDSKNSHTVIRLVDKKLSNQLEFPLSITRTKKSYFNSAQDVIIRLLENMELNGVNYKKDGIYGVFSPVGKKKNNIYVVRVEYKGKSDVKKTLCDIVYDDLEKLQKDFSGKIVNFMRIHTIEKDDIIRFIVKSVFVGGLGKWVYFYEEKISDLYKKKENHRDDVDFSDENDLIRPWVNTKKRSSTTASWAKYYGVSEVKKSIEERLNILNDIKEWFIREVSETVDVEAFEMLTSQNVVEYTKIPMRDMNYFFTFVSAILTHNHTNQLVDYNKSIHWTYHHDKETSYLSLNGINNTQFPTGKSFRDEEYGTIFFFGEKKPKQNPEHEIVKKMINGPFIKGVNNENFVINTDYTNQEKIETSNTPLILYEDFSEKYYLYQNSVGSSFKPSCIWINKDNISKIIDVFEFDFDEIQKFLNLIGPNNDIKTYVWKREQSNNKELEKFVVDITKEEPLNVTIKGNNYEMYKSKNKEIIGYIRPEDLFYDKSKFTILRKKENLKTNKTFIFKDDSQLNLIQVTKSTGNNWIDKFWDDISTLMDLKETKITNYTMREIFYSPSLFTPYILFKNENDEQIEESDQLLKIGVGSYLAKFNPKTPWYTQLNENENLLFLVTRFYTDKDIYDEFLISKDDCKTFWFEFYKALRITNWNIKNMDNFLTKYYGEQSTLSEYFNGEIVSKLYHPFFNENVKENEIKKRNFHSSHKPIHNKIISMKEGKNETLGIYVEKNAMIENKQSVDEQKKRFAKNVYLNSIESDAEIWFKKEDRLGNRIFTFVCKTDDVVSITEISKYTDRSERNKKVFIATVVDSSQENRVKENFWFYNVLSDNNSLEKPNSYFEINQFEPIDHNIIDIKNSINPNGLIFSNPHSPQNTRMYFYIGNFNNSIEESLLLKLLPEWKMDTIFNKEGNVIEIRNIKNISQFLAKSNNDKLSSEYIQAERSFYKWLNLFNKNGMIDKWTKSIVEYLELNVLNTINTILISNPNIWETRNGLTLLVNPSVANIYQQGIWNSIISVSMKEFLGKDKGPTKEMKERVFEDYVSYFWDYFMEQMSKEFVYNDKKTSLPDNKLTNFVSKEAQSLTVTSSLKENHIKVLAHIMCYNFVMESIFDRKVSEFEMNKNQKRARYVVKYYTESQWREMSPSSNGGPRIIDIFFKYCEGVGCEGFSVLDQKVISLNHKEQISKKEKTNKINYSSLLVSMENFFSSNFSQDNANVMTIDTKGTLKLKLYSELQEIINRRYQSQLDIRFLIYFREWLSQMENFQFTLLKIITKILVGAKGKIDENLLKNEKIDIKIIMKINNYLQELRKKSENIEKILFNLDTLYNAVSGIQIDKRESKEYNNVIMYLVKQLPLIIDSIRNRISGIFEIFGDNGIYGPENLRNMLERKKTMDELTNIKIPTFNQNELKELELEQITDIISEQQENYKLIESYVNVLEKTKSQELEIQPAKEKLQKVTKLIETLNDSMSDKLAIISKMSKSMTNNELQTVTNERIFVLNNTISDYIMFMKEWKKKYNDLTSFLKRMQKLEFNCLVIHKPFMSKYNISSQQIDYFKKKKDDLQKENIDIQETIVKNYNLKFNEIKNYDNYNQEMNNLIEAYGKTKNEFDNYQIKFSKSITECDKDNNEKQEGSRKTTYASRFLEIEQNRKKVCNITTSRDSFSFNDMSESNIQPSSDRGADVKNRKDVKYTLKVNMVFTLEPNLVELKHTVYDYSEIYELQEIENYESNWDKNTKVYGFKVNNFVSKDINVEYFAGNPLLDIKGESDKVLITGKDDSFSYLLLLNNETRSLEVEKYRVTL